MLKPLMIALAVVALATVACGGGGSTTPAPSSVPGSPTPDPKITKATIKVTILGTPKAEIPVEESTPTNPASPRPGKTFATEYTGKKGIAKFLGLKPSKTYCWVAKLSPSTTSFECAGWETWQDSDITLGT